MGLDRSSVVKPNVAANLNATAGKDLFHNLKADTTTAVRFLPTTHPTGMLFYVTNNHFKLLDPNSDDGKKKIAVACGKEHGDEGKCFFCELTEALKKTGRKAEKKLADDIKVSVRYNAQVLINEKVGDNFVYTKPKLLGLPGGLSQEISQLLANMEMYNQSPFNDIEAGQDLLLTRTGSGFQTRYKADRSGMTTNLDEVSPGWDSDFIEDIYDALGLKVFTYDEQVAIARHTFGDSIDWSELGL
jgi:hypothetical protein